MRPPRLLIVDDDEARREMYGKALRHEGYHVRTVENGTALFDAVKDDPPDLILLDVCLPGADGFELCGDLRMMDESRLTPIILLTAAETNEESVVRGLLCGADDYICTPGRVAELRARIRVQLRNRRDRELLLWARKQRASFRNAALRDALTGIPNRRAAEDAIMDALGTNVPHMLILMDLDHFKKINDTHGHAAGDVVLREVGKTLDRLLRKGDLVARFGGEEFMLLIRGTDAHLADRIGERFREGVERMRFPESEQIGTVTASLGIATWDGSSPKPTRDEILNAADQVLYQAKREGRNRCCIHHIKSNGVESETTSEPDHNAGGAT